MQKKCYACKEIVPFENFSKDKSRYDGLQQNCKTCNKAYYKKTRAHRLLYRKRYYQEHKA